eukprot:7427818-Lingulodinium_polyedra.AAC.1
MAHPPVSGRGGEAMDPLHCVAPMGFAASASWAQAATEVATEAVGLPGAARVVEGQPTPLEGP